jgi:hypothetical protein
VEVEEGPCEEERGGGAKGSRQREREGRGVAGWEERVAGGKMGRGWLGRRARGLDSLLEEDGTLTPRIYINPI